MKKNWKRLAGPRCASRAEWSPTYPPVALARLQANAVGWIHPAGGVCDSGSRCASARPGFSVYLSRHIDGLGHEPSASAAVRHEDSARFPRTGSATHRGAARAYPRTSGDDGQRSCDRGGACVPGAGSNLESLFDPEVRLYYRFYRMTAVGDKYLSVVVKMSQGDAFVLTAYLTDSVKRGRKVWPETE